MSWQSCRVRKIAKILARVRGGSVEVFAGAMGVELKNQEDVVDRTGNDGRRLACTSLATMGRRIVFGDARGDISCTINSESL